MNEVTKLVESYCEGFCKESGAPGKFDDCTGCEISRVLEQFAASAPAVSGEPVAWRHEMTEPDDNQAPRYLYSGSKNNPWSHWMKEHLEKCRYVCTPLYAAPSALEDAVKAEREPTDLEAWLLDAIDNETDPDQLKGLERALDRLCELEDAIRARKP